MFNIKPKQKLTKTVKTNMTENTYNQPIVSLEETETIGDYAKLQPDKNISRGHNSFDKHEARRLNHANEYNFAINPLNDLVNSSPLNDKIGKFRGRNVTLICNISLEQVCNESSINITFNCAIECAQCNLNEISLGNCKQCKGNGRIEGTRQTQFSIPIGIKSGDIIKLKAMGEAGLKGGITGDLYIKFDVNLHEFYINHQNDIYCRIPISMETLTLGGRINVTLASGIKTTLRILPSNNCYYETVRPNSGLLELTGCVKSLFVKFELFLICKSHKLSTNLFKYIDKFNQTLFGHNLAQYDHTN